MSGQHTPGDYDQLSAGMEALQQHDRDITKVDTQPLRPRDREAVLRATGEAETPQPSAFQRFVASVAKLFTSRRNQES